MLWLMAKSTTRWPKKARSGQIDPKIPTPGGRSVTMLLGIFHHGLILSNIEQ